VSSQDSEFFDPFFDQSAKNPVLRERRGVKWSLSELFRALQENDVDTRALWKKARRRCRRCRYCRRCRCCRGYPTCAHVVIVCCCCVRPLQLCDIVAKTILSVRPRAAHLYRSSRGACRLSTACAGEEEQGAPKFHAAVCLLPLFCLFFSLALALALSPVASFLISLYALARPGHSLPCSLPQASSTLSCSVSTSFLTRA
jgi:hypothetical protein